MQPPEKPKNYRGVEEALVVSICEGEGTQEKPYKIVEYVLRKTADGWKTVGIVTNNEPFQTNW